MREWLADFWTNTLYLAWFDTWDTLYAKWSDIWAGR